MNPLHLTVVVAACGFVVSGCAFAPASRVKLRAERARDALSDPTLSTLIERFEVAGAKVEYGPETITIRLPKRSASPPRGPTLEERLNIYRLPSVSFAGATVEESVEFIRTHFPGCDPEPGFRGFNIVLKTNAAASAKQITMDLKDVPVGEVLRYIAELAGLKMTVEPFAVVISPRDGVR